MPAYEKPPARLVDVYFVGIVFQTTERNEAVQVFQVPAMQNIAASEQGNRRKRDPLPKMQPRIPYEGVTLIWDRL